MSVRLAASWDAVLTAAKRLLQLCTPVLAVASTIIVGPPASGETLADAIALAYQSNPNLQAQRAQLRSVDEGYVTARRGWDPQLSVTLDGTYAHQQQQSFFGGRQDVASNSGQAALVLTQPLYTGGRVAASVNAAAADVRAGRQQLAQTEIEILQATIQAYADVYRDETLLKIYQDELILLQSQVDEAELRLKAGEATVTDVLQSRSQLESARVNYALAQAQLQNSRSNYTAVVGQNPGKLAPPPTLPNQPSTVDEAFDLAETDSPALNLARQTEQASRWRIAEAKAGDRPSVTLQGRYGYEGVLSPFERDAFSRAYAVEAVLTQNLFTSGITESAVRKAIDLNTSDRIGIEATRRTVVKNVAQAWNNVVSLKASAALLANQISIASKYFEDTKIEYRIGQRSTLDVLVAEQAVRGAKVSLSQAEHDHTVAEAGLLAATGRLTFALLEPAGAQYDPARALRQVQGVGAAPWEGVIEGLDRLGGPHPGRFKDIDAPLAATSPVLKAADTALAADTPLAEHFPVTPDKGTASPQTPTRIGQRGASSDPAHRTGPQP